MQGCRRQQVGRVRVSHLKAERVGAGMRLPGPSSSRPASQACRTWRTTSSNRRSGNLLPSALSVHRPPSSCHSRLQQSQGAIKSAVLGQCPTIKHPFRRRQVTQFHRNSYQVHGQEDLLWRGILPFLPWCMLECTRDPGFDRIMHRSIRHRKCRDRWRTWQGPAVSFH